MENLFVEIMFMKYYLFVFLLLWEVKSQEACADLELEGNEIRVANTKPPLELYSSKWICGLLLFITPSVS